MKHLKKFENFDLGHRFSEEEDNEIEFNNMDSLEDCEECEDDSIDFESEDDYGFEPHLQLGPYKGFDDGSEDEDEDEEKDWNDEEELRLERVSSFRSFNEKKMNPGFKAYLDKQKAKKDGKEDKKDNKKTKPDFLDLDKDGNKKESMKKAAKDAKEDDKNDKGGKKGLTAGQKRLPEAMQKAILKKQK